MSQTIAFIGAGNMSAAIIGGLVSKGTDPRSIIASNRSAGKLESLAKQHGIRVTPDNAEAAQADIVVLSVKPQIMKSVCLELKPVLAHQPLIITVAAGIELASYEQWLGTGRPLVRCMPNTPSLVGMGASGLFANSHVTDSQRAQAETLMQAVGIAEWVATEALINAVIAVSGSGPAYYFLMMEAMIDAGVAQGLSHATAKALTLQTVAGAAKLAADADVEVDELRRRVMSPGGTTEQAIQSFESDNIRAIFNRAMTRCANRATEMAKEMGQ